MPPSPRRIRRNREKTEPADKSKSLRARDLPWRTIGITLAPLVLASVVLGLLFFLNGSSEKTVARKAVHAPLLGEPINPLNPRKAELSAPNPELLIAAQLAETEFRQKNYANAERSYRLTLADTAFDTLPAYHVFTCMVLQGHRAEAESFLAHTSNAESTPTKLYAEATLYFLDQHPDQARQRLAKAHVAFAGLCDPYDPTLRALGFLP